MASDTVTIRLQGEVTLEQFASVIGQFSALVGALSKEVVPGAKIQWQVHQLDRGSAEATVRGTGAEPREVERVVTAYGNVGRHAEAGQPIPYSFPVQYAVGQITRTVGNGVTGVVFETPEVDALVRSEIATARSATPYTSYGAMTGRVQTLSNRGSLRFTLYDLIEDRAVSCYLLEGREDAMRDAWGRLARVEGLISRDGVNGRPLAVRQISELTLLDEAPRDSYLEARAVSPSESDLSPEAAIRQLRDG